MVSLTGDLVSVLTLWIWSLTWTLTWTLDSHYESGLWTQYSH